MKLTRFCSLEEFQKFIGGEKLINKTNHSKENGCVTSSIGFCFSKDDPKTAWQYLKGIVSYDICMVVDIQESRLTKSYGRYPDYSNGQLGETLCLKPEYCITSYSNKNATLIKVLKTPDFASSDEIYALRLMAALGLIK